MLIGLVNTQSACITIPVEQYFLPCSPHMNDTEYCVLINLEYLCWYLSLHLFTCLDQATILWFIFMSTRSCSFSSNQFGSQLCALCQTALHLMTLDTKQPVSLNTTNPLCCFKGKWKNFFTFSGSYKSVHKQNIGKLERLFTFPLFLRGTCYCMRGSVTAR